MSARNFGCQNHLALSLACLLVSLGGCQGEQAFYPRSATAPTPMPDPIVCEVDRTECAAEQLLPGASMVTCRARREGPPTRVAATFCEVNPGDLMAFCHAKLCEVAANPMVSYGYDDCQVVRAEAPPANTVPREGTCVPTAAGTGMSAVDFFKHSQACTELGVGVCDPLRAEDTPSPPPPENCYDLGEVPAQTLIQPPSANHDRATVITRVVPNDSRCVQAALFAAAYRLNVGPFGQASGGGVAVPISATRGSVILSRPCATCAFNRLDKLRVNIGNMTVAGAQLTNVVVSSVTRAPLLIPNPDDNTRTGIGPRKLSLIIVGSLNGVPQVYRAENQTAWDLTASATAFRLTGSLRVLNVDASGRPLPVTVSIDAGGAPASAQETACANLNARGRLFGFEDPQQWSSTNAALSLVTSPITQGCGALGINGQGFMPITSVAFTAAGLSLAPALSVDLFIPGNQPNQFWLGALQMHLSCPSVGSNNQYIGQVELTGKPQNQYSTLRFPLPSAVTATLQRAPGDCSFTFGLNVNNTGRTWSLDNLRFTP
jgi:hypothetical protein